MKTFAELRAAWPAFIYRSYSLEYNNDTVCLSWHFEVPGLTEFRPKLELDTGQLALLNEPTSPQAHELAFSLGMVELISYWKATCSPNVIIECGALSNKQAAWWKNLYFGGLGEFFFLNQIETDISSFMTIHCTGVKPDRAAPHTTVAFQSAGLNLIPVGGGKDSVVTLERLRPLEDKNLVFGINPTKAARDCMEIAGYGPERRVILQRTLDPNLLELNRRGFLNGHTPFSAVVAFTSLFCSYLLGVDYIILSNEASANESSVPGTEINHQFSKTSAFEEAFQDYVESVFGLPIRYFSLLRPFNELCIARDFARYPEYFAAFRSCNVGSKKNVWCGECAKCLFIAIMLLPFVGFTGVQEIFGKDILNDGGLAGILDQLTGAVEVKAFECVGTVSEVRYALNLAIIRWRAKAAEEERYERLPVLLERYLLQCRDGRFGALLLDAEQYPFNSPLHPDPLTTFHAENQVPERFLPLLEGMNRKRVEDHLRGKAILLLGFGREGKSSLSWLVRHYPEIQPRKIAVADQNPIELPEDLPDSVGVEVIQGPQYMERIGEFDLVLKSPGISFAEFTDEWFAPGVLRAFPKTEITGQVDLFLRFGPTQKTVGISGTKGKSTTTALIYEMLRQSGRKTELMGNIGTPIFSRIDLLTADTWAVVELSSHQLQFVQQSPQIAVLTNFFQEHLDHYRSYDEYIESKLNIVRYQNKDDVCIIDVSQPELVSRVEPLIKGKLYKVGRDETAEELFCAYDRHNCSKDGSSFFKAGDNPALRGIHNHCDICLATTAVMTAGLNLQEAAQGAKTFSGLPHRLEPVGVYKGIHFYNDSIATIPESAQLAIETLEHVETLLAGGMDRGLDYRPFADFICHSGIRTLICLPDTGVQLAELCRSHANAPRIFLAEEMDEAVQLAYAHTREGAICLLSPAASSYNRYSNFAARGDAFKNAVKTYGQE